MSTSQTSNAPRVKDAWSQPTALRLRKPGLRDPRLLIGLALIALGVGTGSVVVNSASKTIPVYSLVETLPAGESLALESLTIVQVRAPAATDIYLTPEFADSNWWHDEPRMARTVGQGELLPLSAITNSDSEQLRPIAFPSSTGMSEVEVGTRVDLWHVSDVNSDEEARLLVERLEVSAIGEETGPLSFSGAVSITVLVPAENVQEVLNAKSSGGNIELVAHLSGGAP